ncbi:MAG: peptidylprolyl isomerase, partial [Acidimicrobiales bacterium]
MPLRLPLRPSRRLSPALPRRLVAAAACAAVLAAGCGGGEKDADAKKAAAEVVTFAFTGSAATVDGVAIDAQVIGDEVQLLRDHPDFAAQAVGTDQLNQENSTEPRPALVASLLTREIGVTLVEAELKARSLSVSAEQRTLVETALKAQFGSALDGLPAGYRDRFVGWNSGFLALDDALAPPPPSEEQIRKAYDDNAELWTQRCARHVLVQTEEEAQKALADLRSGRDFDQLASERSIDPGSKAVGGSLGCQPKSQYVPEFEDAVWNASLKTLVGPVKTQFGYHVIRVDEEKQLTYADVRDRIAAQLAPSKGDTVARWIAERLAKAQISVDPRFGVWDPAAGQVTPLGEPETPLEAQPGEPGAGAAPPTSAAPAS